MSQNRLLSAKLVVTRILIFLNHERREKDETNGEPSVLAEGCPRIKKATLPEY